MASHNVVTCSDIEHGDSGGFPRPRFLARLKGAWVNCKHLNQPGDMHLACSMMRASSPVKLRNCLLTQKLLSEWSLAHLVCNSQIGFVFGRCMRSFLTPFPCCIVASDCSSLQQHITLPSYFDAHCNTGIPDGSTAYLECTMQLTERQLLH